MHLIDHHGEGEDERLVDLRFDPDSIPVLPSRTVLVRRGVPPVDLRNVHVVAAVADATGYGHRTVVVVAMDDEIGRPIAAIGVAAEEHVDREPHLGKLRLVDGDEEPVAPARAAVAPERLPMVQLARAELLDGDQRAWRRGDVEEAEGA